MGSEPGCPRWTVWWSNAPRCGVAKDIKDTKPKITGEWDPKRPFWKTWWLLRDRSSLKNAEILRTNAELAMGVLLRGPEGNRLCFWKKEDFPDLMSRNCAKGWNLQVHWSTSPRRSIRMCRGLQIRVTFLIFVLHLPRLLPIYRASINSQPRAWS